MDIVKNKILLVRSWLASFISYLPSFHLKRASSAKTKIKKLIQRFFFFTFKAFHLFIISHYPQSACA